MAKSLSIKPSAEQPEEKLLTNPYPGLRPFSFTEKHLYYGREGQSEKILELLTTNRFVAIIGPSGCGKSSLINCGIIPQLYGGYLYEAGSRWKIARMHPGYSPIESLSITLTETFASQKMTEEQIEAETNMNYVLFTKKALEIASDVGYISSTVARDIGNKERKELKNKYGENPKRIIRIGSTLYWNKIVGYDSKVKYKNGFFLVIFAYYICYSQSYLIPSMYSFDFKIRQILHVSSITVGPLFFDIFSAEFLISFNIFLSVISSAPLLPEMYLEIVASVVPSFIDVSL